MAKVKQSVSPKMKTKFLKFGNLFLPAYFSSPNQQSQEPESTTIVGTYFQYSELSKIKPTFDSILDRIKSFNSGSLVSALALMNHLATSINIRNDSEIIENQIGFAKNFIRPSLLKKIKFLSNDFRVIIHRQQLLSLIKWVMLLNIRDQFSNKEYIKNKYFIGDICLMMNDFLALDVLNPDDIEKNSTEEDLKLLTEILPIMEIQNQHNLSSMIVRFSMMFRELDSSRIFSRSFIKKVGLKYEEYFSLIIVIWGHYRYLKLKDLMENKKSLHLDPAKILPDLISKIKMNRFLKNTAIDLKEASNYIYKQMRYAPSVDLLALRKKPILKISNKVIVCLDLHFLIDKIGYGFIWEILDSLTGEEKNNFLGKVGEQYEKYLNYLFRNKYPQSQLITSPEFLPKVKAKNKKNQIEDCFDGVLNYGNKLIIMEYKSALLSSRAKYGGDPLFLKKELEEKYIGSRKNKKGVMQLILWIERIFKTKEYKLEALNIDLNKVNSIYPIIILLEPIMHFNYVNWYLNNVFQEEINKLRITGVKINPLILISTDHIERIDTINMSFDEQLDRKINFDPNLKCSFDDFYCREKWANNDDGIMMKKWEEIGDEVKNIIKNRK